MRVVLEIVSGPDAGKKLRLEPGKAIRVGRTHKSDFSLPNDTYMSGEHFALECERGACYIGDLQSRNGTSVNGERIERATLHNGDQIFAGETVFVIHIESDAPPLRPETSPLSKGTDESIPFSSSKHIAGQATANREGQVASRQKQHYATKPLPASANQQFSSAATLEDNLLEILRGQSEPLFALLDAARDPKVLEMLRSCEEEHQSLYEGKKGEELDNFAPYLVRLPAQSSLLEMLVREGWGKSWGLYFTCDRPFRNTRRYLRQFLLVRTEDGRELYFRFYDPRVLRVFLPTCLPDEINRLFGPISSYLMEADKREMLLQFTNSGQGAKQTTLVLSAQQRLDSSTISSS